MPISIKPCSPQAEEHKRQDTQDSSCREASTRSFDSLAQLPRCQVGLPADLGLKPLYTSYHRAASVGNRAPPHGGGASRGAFPLRATTTAADPSRDARAARK
jgi:hypothetical protein